MKSQLSQHDFLDSNGSSEGVQLDLKRVFYRALKYWYFIVLSLGIGLTIAYLKNRYATRIYPVTASIIIKETQESSEGRLLYNNPLVSFYRNYLNELYIIRSYPLIQSTIEKLDFELSFFQEGNLLITETYQSLAVNAKLISSTFEGELEFNFQGKDNKTFLLTPDGDSNDSDLQIFNYNDTISFQGLDLYFYLNDTLKFPRSTNKYVVRYKSSILQTGSYVSRLSAEWAEEGAGVINLSINGPNPEKEIDFLAGLISEYQETDLEKKSLAASRTIEFINEQLQNISDSLRKAERQLELFKNKNVVTDLNEEALRLLNKSENLELQKTELVINENYYNYLLKYISQGEALDQVILPGSIGITDNILGQLVSQMIAIQLEIRTLQKNGKIESPYVPEKSRRLQELRKDIIESVNNQRSVDKIKLDYLNKEIAAIEKQLDYLPVAERQLISIKRNYTLLENLYVFLLQKRAEAAISKASTTSDIIVVNPPRKSGGQISPKPTQNYLVAGFLGFSIPIIVFVLLELANSRIQSKEDLEKLTTIPFLGGVGHKSANNNIEVLERPKTAIAESFRALRANLNYFMGKRDNGVFLVTSSISGEGKTFTTINLASVISLSNKRTLIIGADMRRPKLFDDFSLTNHIGLSNYLAGVSSFDEIVQQTPYENLFIVSGGPIPPNPSELLMTERMGIFIKEARAHYDYVIIDSPPLAIVSDAFSLVQYVDHTLFIVRQNYTAKGMVKAIDEFYKTEKLKEISIVLNDIYKSGPGYGYGYGYHYGYGYSYGYGYGASSGYYTEEPKRKGLLAKIFKRS